MLEILLVRDYSYESAVDEKNVFVDEVQKSAITIVTGSTMDTTATNSPPPPSHHP